jgi:hypothetical protein
LNLSLRATEGSEAIWFLQSDIRDRFVAIAPPASPGEAGAGLAMTYIKFFRSLLFLDSFEYRTAVPSRDGARQGDALLTLSIGEAILCLRPDPDSDPVR